ncbi:MAG: tyrosine-type recombinase/integrase [Terriglobales bacterium]|jgi:integrase
MNRQVNVTKRIQTAQGMRYCPVVLSANGRVKPDAVLVNGKEERHPEGAYYLEWREGAKRVRLSVGKDAADATARRLRKEAELNAVNLGAAIVPEKNKEGQRSLVAAVADYLEDVRLKQTTNKRQNFGRHNTTGCYSTALAYFTESCHKMNLEEIDRHDLLKYANFLQTEKDQGPRSVYNKFQIVMSFLKAHGIRGLVGKTDWPRYTETEPEIYEKEELDALFATCDAEERLWFEFFLMTGMREQEVIFTYWKDVNFTASTVRVSFKPDAGWSPKAYKEREIPIPTKLAKSLKEWKAKAAKGCPFVFATSGCKPKHDFLDCLKAIAERADLDPDNFWLHKFRATFATWSLWEGVDLRTVQQWLGHSDIESTMRYLKPSRSVETRAKVNKIFA